VTISAATCSLFTSPCNFCNPCTSVSDLSQYPNVANRHEHRRRRNTNIIKSKAALRSIFTLLSTRTSGYITCAQHYQDGTTLWRHFCWMKVKLIPQEGIKRAEW